MTKIASCIGTLVLVLTLGISFAQESGEKQSMMGEGKMKDECMKRCMMCPTHGMVMKMMMGKELVATEDGGVIVMMGNKLVKYDKDLNQQKEVEIKVDVKEMGKLMKQIQEECPMHQKMVQEQKMMPKESGEKMSGHEGHHN